jgi:DNA-binding NtrC family response regulator
MFGHVKGAFTGAIRDKPGLLETANGGTIFLDELTEMSPAVQAKLLRVIQDGVVRRVGSNSTDAVVTVRFIAATNRDTREAVETGVLRQDLFYRLCVVPIHLPALRERREDIPALAEHFLGVYWQRHREPRAAMPRLSPAALRSLQLRPWTGNVRELQNVIEHAVVLLAPGATVEPEDLPVLDGAAARAPACSYTAWDGDETYHDARERVIADFERDYLRRLVGQASGNMSQAAKIAGVDRTTLYRLMDKHGMQRDTILTTRDG